LQSITGIYWLSLYLLLFQSVLLVLSIDYWTCIIVNLFKDHIDVCSKWLWVVEIEGNLVNIFFYIMLIYISTIYWSKIQTFIIYILFLDGMTLDSDVYVTIVDNINRDGGMKLIL
jgi:hypothetical protein